LRQLTWAHRWKRQTSVKRRRRGDEERKEKKAAESEGEKEKTGSLRDG
jgi:hypothetical protein